MARASVLVSLCVAVFCVGVSAYYVKGAEIRIRDRIKKELRAEMDQEIRLAVAKAMPSHPASIPARERVVSQRLASLDELGLISAGVMDTGVPVVKGFSKKTQAAEGAKIASASEQSDAVAGKTSERAIESALLARGGMLLPKGKMQVEPSFTIAHFSSNRINIEGFAILPVLVIGEISTESVKRDVFIPAVTLRRGLLKNFQGEIKIPGRYEYDRVTSNLGAETNRYDYGIGDIEVSFSRQISWERGIIPDSVASFTIKTPTGGSPYGMPIGLGTGHWGFKGALVAVKSSDPAVVFGSVNYAYNVEKDIEDYGRVKPGNSIGYSLGTAIGLSYQTAINFAFEQNVTYKMNIDGHNVKGSFLNAADLKCGLTWAISDRSSLIFAVTMGLTTDAPDYVAEISFPYTF